MSAGPVDVAMGMALTPFNDRLSKQLPLTKGVQPDEAHNPDQFSCMMFALVCVCVCVCEMRPRLLVAAVLSLPGVVRV